ncbi:Ribosomal protein S6 kinase alpha-5 [Actinomortierella wolfii]|nr:Ribosomal protein S6 kinase alpha-5 [Actinomortierella wolfii]
MVQLFPCGLDITAVSATDLAKRKRFGAQDPYLLFHLQGRRKFTCVAVKGGSKPQWNQMIRFRRVNNPISKDDTILKVYCFHEKTGVSIMSTDGLIGQCEVDLQQTVFKSPNDTLTLQNDGKTSGKVFIRIKLCEASDEPETSETAPIRPEPERKGLFGHSSKDKDKDKEKEKEKDHNKESKNSKHTKSHSASSMGPLTAAARPGQKEEIGSDSSSRTSGHAGRLNRPQSMENINALSQFHTKIKFQEPLHKVHGSQSLDEVRALNTSTPASESNEGDHSNNASTASVERSPEPSYASSPPPRFISQDDEGNLNQLRLLTAPLDPSWLQPTPPTLRRALSAQYFYGDMPEPHNQQQQQQHQQQGIYPPMAEPYQRPLSQQSHYPGYNPDAFFNNSYSNPGSGVISYNSMSALVPLGQAQQQQVTQQPYPVMPTSNTGGQQYPDPSHASQIGLLPPLPSQQPSPRNQQTIPGTVPYQPHTVFQPRQPNRSHMNNFELNKHASLPSRHLEGRFPDPTMMGPATLSPVSGQQAPSAQTGPPQQQQQKTQPVQSADYHFTGPMSGVSPAEAASTMAVAAAISAAAAAAAPTVTPKAPDANTLGPCGGGLPEAYSQQNQQRLADMIPIPVTDDTASRPPAAYSLASPSEAAAALNRNHPPLHPPSAPPAALVPVTASATAPASWSYSTGTDPMMAMSTAPAARSASAGALLGAGANAHYHPQPATNPMQFSQQARDGSLVLYASPTVLDHNIPPRPVSRAAYDPRAGSSMSMASNWEPLETMTSSPAIPVPTKIPERARDTIYAEFRPMTTPVDGRDIQDSLRDESLGRLVVDRYTTGPFREKYVREGLYVNRQQRRSPTAPLTAAMQQLSLQSTGDGEGNDRVILKYSMTQKEWEIDSVMVRYLVHTKSNDALENHLAEYRARTSPQKQQSLEVNPFVVGLYDAFVRSAGGLENECRLLSVCQWYPETLSDYIMDCTASGEGLAVTLPVVRTLIECIRWIHDRKICHLNLKPSNFARDPFAASRRSSDGAGWKLIDFESARVIGEEPVGRCTFTYAAPEILRGHLADVPVLAHGSMDVWSLGLVIYEVLTDQPLFHTDDQTQNAVLQASVSTSGAAGSGSLKPIRYYDASKVSKEYQPLLDAMITEEPSARLSAKELLQMSIFHTPITNHGVAPHELLRNNNVLTLRDVKAVRLCNLCLMPNQSESSFNQNNSSPPRIPSAMSPHDQPLLEGLSRILDSPFHQIPRLFMILPPTAEDLDPSRPFVPSQLLQQRNLRLVLLCEGLSGYGEDAHVTDHYGYRLGGDEDDYSHQYYYDNLQSPRPGEHDHHPQSRMAFIQAIGKILLHLVSVAGTNHPGTETPMLDQPWTRTGTPLDNLQPWFPTLRSYYATLQAALQQALGGAVQPSMQELLALREPTLKAMERWLVMSRRRSPLMGHHQSPPPNGAGSGLQSGPIDGSMLVEEVTGPGGGEGYGGLYKMPVGTCGHRWICRGCVSRLMSL